MNHFPSKSKLLLLSATLILAAATLPGCTESDDVVTNLTNDCRPVETTNRITQGPTLITQYKYDSENRLIESAVSDSNKTYEEKILVEYIGDLTLGHLDMPSSVELLFNGVTDSYTKVTHKDNGAGNPDEYVVVVCKDKNQLDTIKRYELLTNPDKYEIAHIEAFKPSGVIPYVILDLTWKDGNITSATKRTDGDQDGSIDKEEVLNVLGYDDGFNPIGPDKIWVPDIEFFWTLQHLNKNNWTSYEITVNGNTTSSLQADWTYKPNDPYPVSAETNLNSQVAGVQTFKYQCGY